jgi:flagellar protein FliO/FliZ
MFMKHVMPVYRHIATVMLLFFTHTAMALEAARPLYVPPVAGTGNMVKITLSLLLVLAVIVGIAWLLKRLNLTQQGKGNVLRVIGSVAIGQRERVVLVEVGDTWLLVGVGPGQIRTLHTLEKGSAQAPLPASDNATDNQFGKLLSSMLKNRQSGRKSDAS